MEKWRFLDTGANSGAFNMATDEAILDIHWRGLTPPTLRVFQWSPPALSLGRLQNLKRIDLEKCKNLGIDVVRRPTGGAAVLHKTELTYSIVSSEKYGIPLSLRKSHAILNQGLIIAYKILGVEISPTVSSGHRHSDVCFSTNGQTDLAYQGKKLIGSVWLRRENAILQHGSLIVNKQESEPLFSIIRFPSEEIKDQAFQNFKQRATSLSEIIKEISWQDIKAALFEGFQMALGIELFETELGQEEILKAERLLSKYQNLKDGE